MVIIAVPSDLRNKGQGQHQTYTLGIKEASKMLFRQFGLMVYMEHAQRLVYFLKYWCLIVYFAILKLCPNLFVKCEGVDGLVVMKLICGIRIVGTVSCERQVLDVLNV